MGRGSEASRIQRCRLGRESIRHKENLREISSIGSVTVSWYNRKQRLVALNSVEAECMSASQKTCEDISMRKILIRLFGQHIDPTVIYCDNKSCIKLFENLVFHDQSKHIDI